MSKIFFHVAVWKVTFFRHDKLEKDVSERDGTQTNVDMMKKKWMQRGKTLWATFVLKAPG